MAGLAGREIGGGHGVVEADITLRPPRHVVDLHLVARHQGRLGDGPGGRQHGGRGEGGIVVRLEIDRHRGGAAGDRRCGPLDEDFNGRALADVAVKGGRAADHGAGGAEIDDVAAHRRGRDGLVNSLIQPLFQHGKIAQCATLQRAPRHSLGRQSSAHARASAISSALYAGIIFFTAF